MVIVFNAADHKSFEECDEYIELAKEFGDNKQLIVAVGLNTDLADNRVISKEEAEEFFSHYERHIGYFEASVASGEGINDFFRSAIKKWLSNQFNDNSSIDKRISNEPNLPKPEEKKESELSCNIC